MSQIWGVTDYAKPPKQRLLPYRLAFLDDAVFIVVLIAVLAILGVLKCRM
jgi:hypothetical protein